MVLTLTVVAMLLILVVTRDMITLACVFTIGAVGVRGALLGGNVAAAVGRLHRGVAVVAGSDGRGVGHPAPAHSRRYPVSQTDDAAALARETGIPGIVWITG